MVFVRSVEDMHADVERRLRSGLRDALKGLAEVADALEDVARWREMDEHNERLRQQRGGED